MALPSSVVLPETGFIRLRDLLRFIPIGRSTWLEGVRTGIYPAPVKLTARCVAWRAEDIRALIVAIGRGAGA